MELMDTEFNDKILYTHRRCEETLFAGMPAGINRYGSREEIAALHREELSAAWEELLKNARFEIFALGDCQPDPALFRKRFSGFGKPLHGEYLPFSVPRQQKRGEEKMPLSQSKLSLAFRADLQPEERLLFQLANAVWGGTPSSKLFQNVREKQSLCYYCSSALDAPARTLYVESGVEQENLGRAEEEINRQLSLLQAGQVTEEELQAAKLALRNSLQSIGDSLSAVENWCVSRMFDNFLTLPQQAVETLMGYTLDDVISAARRIFPAAAFCLKGMNTP